MPALWALTMVRSNDATETGTELIGRMKYSPPIVTISVMIT